MAAYLRDVYSESSKGDWPEDLSDIDDIMEPLKKAGESCQMVGDSECDVSRQMDTVLAPGPLIERLSDWLRVNIVLYPHKCFETSCHTEDVEPRRNPFQICFSTRKQGKYKKYS